jgi:hypothetical protein
VRATCERAAAAHLYFDVDEMTLIATRQTSVDARQPREFVLSTAHVTYQDGRQLAARHVSRHQTHH